MELRGRCVGPLRKIKVLLLKERELDARKAKLIAEFYLLHFHQDVNSLN